MADYSALVTSLQKVTELGGRIYPIRAPEREKKIPLVIYIPITSDVIEALDGWATQQTVQIDVIAKTFESLNRLQQTVISTLYNDGVVIQAPTASFTRYDPDLQSGVFVVSIDVVMG